MCWMCGCSNPMVDPAKILSKTATDVANETGTSMRHMGDKVENVVTHTSDKVENVMLGTTERIGKIITNFTKMMTKTMVDCFTLFATTLTTFGTGFINTFQKGIDTFASTTKNVIDAVTEFTNKWFPLLHTITGYLNHFGTTGCMVALVVMFMFIAGFSAWMLKSEPVPLQLQQMTNVDANSIMGQQHLAPPPGMGMLGTPMAIGNPYGAPTAGPGGMMMMPGMMMPTQQPGMMMPGMMMPTQQPGMMMPPQQPGMTAPPQQPGMMVPPQQPETGEPNSGTVVQSVAVNSVQQSQSGVMPAPEYAAMMNAQAMQGYQIYAQNDMGKYGMNMKYMERQAELLAKQNENAFDHQIKMRKLENTQSHATFSGMAMLVMAVISAAAGGSAFYRDPNAFLRVVERVWVPQVAWGLLIVVTAIAVTHMNSGEVF